MTDTPSRRSLLASSAAAFTLPLARAASDGKLRAGLIGCGGRGTQAVTDMLTGTENVELVAMADVFEDKLEGSLKRLRDGAGLKRYAGTTVTRDTKPWQGDPLAFQAPFTRGDKASWENALKLRQQGQNEYIRIGGK